MYTVCLVDCLMIWMLCIEFCNEGIGQAVAGALVHKGLRKLSLLARSARGAAKCPEGAFASFC